MGLIVSVYRDASGYDCTLGGVSSKHKDLLVVNVEGPFEPAADLPAVILERHVPGCLRIVPAVREGSKWVRASGWWMFGGNFAHTSDSRFGEAARALLGTEFYGAVAVHDRQEN